MIVHGEKSKRKNGKLLFSGTFVGDGILAAPAEKCCVFPPDFGEFEVPAARDVRETASYGMRDLWHIRDN